MMIQKLTEVNLTSLGLMVDSPFPGEYPAVLKNCGKVLVVADAECASYRRPDEPDRQRWYTYPKSTIEQVSAWLDKLTVADFDSFR